MSVLDLQGLPAPEGLEYGGGSGRSSNSKHSCNGSNLSAAICGGHSALSVTVCGH